MYSSANLRYVGTTHVFMFMLFYVRINTVSSGLVRTQNILGKDHFFCRHQQHVLERFSKNESESEL